MRPFVCLLLLVAAACGGGRPAGPTPELGPTLAVDQFMKAVADSNLAGMAELWGTRSGPASVTGQPNDFRRRIQVMHAYLKSSTAKVLGVREDRGDQVVMVVELTRPNCRRQVPFTTVRWRDNRWLVQAIDLAELGAPGSVCPGPARPGR